MRKKVENLSNKITRSVGSPLSIVIHTIFFIGIFSLKFFGFDTEDILLILTTLVSLEAIYLSIFIQMTVNQHAKDLEEVSEDIEEIQENVEEIQEDVEGISEDVEEISEDVGEISEDVGEIQKDVDELQEDVESIEKDVEDIQENVEEINEEESEENETDKFARIEKTLESLLVEISKLKK